MRVQTADKPSLVPFPKVFALVGFTVFCAVACLYVLETGSKWIYNLAHYRNSPLRHLQADSPANSYPCRGTGNSGCPVADPKGLNLTSASPAYNNYPWAEDFWKELRDYDPSFYIPPYEPFRLWGMKSFHGKYLNVDDSPLGQVRRTINEFGKGCDAKSAVKVWFFGGSTAWGFGTPDFATIPSYLSAQLNQSGKACVEVTNLGVDGYNSNQELLYLDAELKAGGRPELVIFYDGVNDLDSLPFEPPEVSTHLLYRQIKSKFESPIISWPGLASRSNIVQLAAGVRRRYLQSDQPEHSSEEWATIGTGILNTYENNLRMARALGKEYGFEVYAFWQPSLAFGSKPLTPFEKFAAGPMNADEAGARGIYEDAERRAAANGDFVFLSRIFDKIDEPLFIDYAHLGPRGNEIVVGAIAQAVANSPALRNEGNAPGTEKQDVHSKANTGGTANGNGSISK